MRFADTSFWVALKDRSDRHHHQALALVQHGLGRVLMTNHVMGETWILLVRRGNHRVATGFLDEVERLANLEVVHVERAIEKEAWAWLRRHDEREYSFVDATSFAVMRRRRIREALALDGDFHAAGFVEVRAS